MEVQQQHNRVIFENVADQYVKGEDVTAFFTILHGTKVNPNEDQIGLIRIGCTNIKECLSYTRIQFNPSKTSESISHGTGTFSSSSLVATNDEFYQFCYINNKTTNLGSSIPFQLNCTLDEIDLLSNTSLGKTNSDGFIILSVHDNHDMQIFKPTINRSLSNQYQTECLHCRTVEDAHAKTLNETNRIRSQLNTTSQLATDQAIQIVDLEHRLMKSNELIKTSSQNQTSLEQQLRDLNLTFEKYQKSTQGQLNAYAKQKNLLEIKNPNEHQLSLEQQLRDLSLTSEKYQRSTQGQLNAYSKQKDQIQYQQAYMALKISFTEIEKRCIKHQKSETDLKRQLSADQNVINDLQDEIQYLTERLSASTEEYKTLFHKYNTLERKTGRNYQQEKVDTINDTTFNT